MNFFRKLFFVFTLLFFFYSSSLRGCTGIKLMSKDKQVVHGRTLEFATPLEVSFAFVPRGCSFYGKTSHGKGLSYQNKYAMLGAILCDELALADGINEKGLSVATFYFPGYASYTQVNEKNQNKGLSPLDFPNWILATCSSLEDVKRSVKEVIITPTILPNWGKTPPPFHYIIYDNEGEALVIEPVQGTLKVHENPLGVLTNSPEFSWHMTNLRNYINLRMNNVKPITVEGLTFAPLGQGSGMVGLPGDFTPPSRFVRAVAFSYTMLPASDQRENILNAFHLLNQFDIPKGIERETENDQVFADYTMFTCVKDPSSLKYYFKTYEDQTIKVIDLNDFDWNDKQIKKLNFTSEQPFVDVTKTFKSSE